MYISNVVSKINLEPQDRKLKKRIFSWYQKRFKVFFNQ